MTTTELNNNAKLAGKFFGFSDVIFQDFQGDDVESITIIYNRKQDSYYKIFAIDRDRGDGLDFTEPYHFIEIKDVEIVGRYDRLREFSRNIAPNVKNIENEMEKIRSISDQPLSKDDVEFVENYLEILGCSLYECGYARLFTYEFGFRNDRNTL